MGGNVLKKTKTERKNPVEYNRIKTVVLEIVKPHIKCEVVTEAPEKESYGDLDIIYLSNKDVDIKELLIELFNPPEIVSNGDVISFAFEAFQIDMIKALSEEEYESKKFYFGYGDLGCILGKMANFYKLKFGSQGFYIHIEKSIDGKPLDITKDIGKDIILTTKPKEFCDFFGLDYLKRQTGFETENEMFDWVCSSKYFIKGIFQIENQEDRRRMETRNVYQNFMKYIWKDTIDTTKPERIYLQKYALDYFNKQTEFDFIVQEVKIFESRKAKYNGKIFIEHGISGKEIPNKMKDFETMIKTTKDISNFYDWLDSVNEESVKAEVTSFLLIKK